MSRRVSAIVAVFVLSSFLTGCGHFGQQDGERLVKSVGPDKLRAAAASIRSRVTVPAAKDECRDVPQNLWPDALRDLDAERVCINANGLMITKYTFFVEWEGLHIVFEGGDLPSEGGSDPAFRQLSYRIYWFHYSG